MLEAATPLRALAGPPASLAAGSAAESLLVDPSAVVVAVSTGAGAIPGGMAPVVWAATDAAASVMLDTGELDTGEAAATVVAPPPPDGAAGALPAVAAAAPDTSAPDTDAPDTDAPDTGTPGADAPDTDAPGAGAPGATDPEAVAPAAEAVAVVGAEDGAPPCAWVTRSANAESAPWGSAPSRMAPPDANAWAAWPAVAVVVDVRASVGIVRLESLPQECGRTPGEQPARQTAKSRITVCFYEIQPVMHPAGETGAIGRNCRLEQETAGLVLPGVLWPPSCAGIRRGALPHIAILCISTTYTIAPE